MSEEAKAGLANEALAICSNGQKDRVKRGGRFCKNWQLDHDNSDVE